MKRALELASLFLGFGLVAAGGDYASEAIMSALREKPERIRSVQPVEVAVTIERPEVDVDVQVFGSGACAYEAQRAASLPASAASLLRVRAGSGELAVQGREGLARVEVVARACASREEDLAGLQITLEQQGADIVLSAHYPERSTAPFRNSYARLDLVVEVPLGIAAEIQDGSGGMELAGTGALQIRDGSGEIRITDALGAVEIQDSSGEIELFSISGNVTIEDSSGELRIENATGDVDIEDGSGEIELRLVQGQVRIRDGSGGIDAEQVSGSVTVEEDGSGEIRVRDVTGDFTVSRDGSGGIAYSGVGGRVDIPRRGRRGDG